MASSGATRHCHPWGNSLKNDRETSHRSDTTTSDVEVELSDRDTHSAETKVTKTKDTRSVSDDNDLGLVGSVEGGIVLGKDIAERVLVVDVDVETLRSGVDVGVLLASLTDGGGVDNGGTGVSGLQLTRSDSQVDKVGLDSREEELGVLPAHAREEAVLEEASGHLLELVLETQERLLPGEAGPGESGTSAEG